ncbi:alanine racemase [Quadrisphaera granulorum]|uniref:Alanine racemase n=1 Tax=Quadrisphaera granulorum TaxID=317664 RepID=A0A316ACI2_9ACTN|nr:alanine racemase [Quadrisphaera granulorum]PWJ55433.1 alanine racemase [Quadrisphaera granulorum]SZE95497.1 alanine racemase [Quadrisphaera granulorum]
MTDASREDLRGDLQGDLRGDPREDLFAPTWTGQVVVDLDAIAANTALLVERAAPAAVMAVVKADAYGHGLVPAARAALAGGATWLGVAQLAEALALRAAGVTAPVLCWLWAPGQDVASAVAAGINLSASSQQAVEILADAARATGRPVRLHLEVETGMGRGGAAPQDWPGAVRAALVARAEGLADLVGAWSHLARSDEPADPCTTRQRGAFTEALAVAEGLGATFSLRHLANSAALLTAPETHFDLVRPGIAVYGLSPGPEVGTSELLGLRPAMSVRTRLALVKDVGAGQGVSYGHTYTTDRPTRLGLVPLGYADGVPRAASGVGPVVVAGGRTTVAGRVCMDQFVVDLGGLPGADRAAAGDLVELFGDGALGGPTAEDWAHACGTIGYEVLARMSARLPRRYTGTAGVQQAVGAVEAAEAAEVSAFAEASVTAELERGQR